MSSHSGAYWNYYATPMRAYIPGGQSWQVAQPASAASILAGDHRFQLYPTPRQSYHYPHADSHFPQHPAHTATQHICVASNEKINEEPSIPIRAPVPLLYSQRNKAGLKVMESIAQKGSERLRSTLIVALTSSLLAADSKSQDEGTDVRDDKGALNEDVASEADISGTTLEEDPVFNLRPATPSTMLALTDPCLMPPLDETDLKFLQCGGDQADTSPDVQVHAPQSELAPRPTDCSNIWGY